LNIIRNNLPRRGNGQLLGSQERERERERERETMHTIVRIKFR
jgi:hypothetical protein